MSQTEPNSADLLAEVEALRARLHELEQRNIQTLQAAKALRTSEQDCRIILDSMGDAIHVVDADLRILIANATLTQWCLELGLPSDVVGRKVTEIFPFLPDKLVAEYEQVFRDAKILMTQERFQVGDRTIITEIRKIPVVEKQKVVRVITAIHDITEQKRAQDERAQLETQLYQAQKLEAIGQLAGGVAHDFNNLLVVIVGNASMLQKDKSLPPKVCEALGDITAAAERGSSLTKQLLDFARGGIQQPIATDLNRLIQLLVPMLQRTTPAEIKFKLKLGDPLALVLADPPRIEQVIVNLCLNAVQATKPPGTITLSTAEETIDARRAVGLQLKPGRYIHFRIQDSGCGIPPEIRERIFEPFYSTKEMGRGLGLSVTHSIIQSHRGQIRVDDTHAKGASISVWLPVTDQQEAVVGLPAPLQRLDPIPRGTETILVIDRQATSARSADRILSSLGYCVITHTDANQAIAFLGTNSEDINLVVCDKGMSSQGREKLTKTISLKYPRLPVLLAIDSSNATSTSHRKIKNGIRAIQKPFVLRALAEAVRTALDQHAEQSEK